MVKKIEELIREKIRDIKDFPVKGIVFKDITPLLAERGLFNACIDELAKQTKQMNADYFAAIEARGFLVGAPLAVKMGAGLIPIRKKGKLPGDTVNESYVMEYGTNTLEIHKDAVKNAGRVVIVDDLLATGNSAKTAASLVKKVGGKVVGFVFIIELSDLNGRKTLGDYPTVSLIKYSSK